MGMESLLEKRETRGVNKLLIVGLVIGAAAVAVVLWLLSLRPPADQQMARLLEAAYHEGHPEFAGLSKDIIISTDDRTVESPTAFGTISMYINGKIRNKGQRTIDILEVKVSVVTQFGDVLKEKRILVVPVQQPALEPDQVIPITLTMDGFSRDDDRANIRWKVTAIRAR
jgi:hypothetical protein